MICNPVSVLVQAVTLRDNNHQGSGKRASLSEFSYWNSFSPRNQINFHTLVVSGPKMG